MQIESIVVQASWDDVAQVWVATSEDITGLSVEAPTWDALSQKVLAALGDLIELNETECDLAEIPVRLIAGRTLHIPNTVTADARAALFERLERQPVINAGNWTRDELYEDES